MNKGKNGGSKKATPTNETATNEEVAQVNDTVETVKASEIADTPEMELSDVKVVGDKVEGKLPDGQTVQVDKVKARKVLATLPGVGQVIITYPTLAAKPGRPSNPNSARQQQLAEKAKRLAELKEMGIETGKRGRPANPNSARQILLKEKAEHKQQIIAAKKKELGKEAKDMTDEEIGLLCGFGKKGRPADPNSKRQQELAEKEARKAANGGKVKLGRPKTKEDEIVVAEAVVVTSDEAEEA